MVIEITVAGYATGVEIAQQISLNEPAVSGDIEGFTQVRMQFGGLDRTEIEPSQIVDMNLRTKRICLLAADVDRTLQIEPDIVALEHRNAGALGIEEWTDCALESVAIRIVGEQSIRQWNEDRGDAFWDTDSVRDKTMFWLGLGLKEHDYLPLGRTTQRMLNLKKGWSLLRTGYQSLARFETVDPFADVALAPSESARVHDAGTWQCPAFDHSIDGRAALEAGEGHNLLHGEQMFDVGTGHCRTFLTD